MLDQKLFMDDFEYYSEEFRDKNLRINHASSQLFTHVCKDTGTRRLFVIDNILMYAFSLLDEDLLNNSHGVELMKIGIDPDFADFIKEERGVDLDYCGQLTREKLDNPVIFFDFSDGTHLLVDGHHRYYQSYLLGDKSVNAIVLEPRHIDNFSVKIPPHLHELFDNL